MLTKNLEEYSIFIIRIGLAVVFLLFGIDKFINPESWFVYVPIFILQFTNLNFFIFLLGILETIIGLFLLIGFLNRLAALIAALFLLSIIFTIGYNEITVRDIGLLAMAISLIITKSNLLSLDSLIKKRIS